MRVEGMQLYGRQHQNNGSCKVADDECKTLYKYRSLGGEYGRVAVEKAIVDFQLWWQQPSSFSDPFDCQPHFIFGENARDRAKYARDLANRKMTGQSRKSRLLSAKRMRGMTQDRAREMARVVIDRSVVTCFAQSADNALMWAHYASNHTGVCLIFQESLAPTFISLSVNYSSSRPTVDMIELSQGKGEVLAKIMLTKSDCWSYEQECRMMMRGSPGYVMFPAKCLTGVILGARISDDDQQFVLDAIGRRKTALPVLRAELDARDYRVNIVQV